jgi:hypothetical protein
MNLGKEWTFLLGRPLPRSVGFSLYCVATHIGTRGALISISHQRVGLHRVRVTPINSLHEIISIPKQTKSSTLHCFFKNSHACNHAEGVIGVAVFKNGPFRLLYNQVAQQ